MRTLVFFVLAAGLSAWLPAQVKAVLVEGGSE